MEARPRLVGGDVAVDLVNTLDPDLPAGDYFLSDADVAVWLDHVGLGGRATLARARSARAAIDAVLRPLAEGADPARADLDALLALERDGLAHAVLAPGGLTFGDPLARIVHSAVELVRGGPIGRLKRCGNCPWLFIDSSRNGSRRWCSMEACGTHVKIARLTQRRRSAR